MGRAVEGKMVPRQNSFELYGFDLMVDEDMRMWLLEVNLSPGCEGRTPYLDNMLSRMSKRLVEVAVLGNESPDGEQPDWVNICDDASDSKVVRMLDAAQRGPRDLPCTVDLTVHGQQMRLPQRGRRPVAVAGEARTAAGVVTSEEEEEEEDLKNETSLKSTANYVEAHNKCLDDSS